jgi:hypothetical protein
MAMRVSGTKAAKGARPVKKPQGNGKPALEFAGKLANAGKAAGPQTKSTRTDAGPEIRESRTGDDGLRLEIVDAPSAAMRTVGIRGTVDRFHRDGTILDGRPAHAGKVDRVATVTVSVEDTTGRTARTYKGDQVPRLTVHLGNQTGIMTVDGEVATSIDLVRGPAGDIAAGAGNARFTGRDARTAAPHGVSFSRPAADRGSLTTFVGSSTRDIVAIDSRGLVAVAAGSGDDVVLARGNTGSVVDGGPGKDAIGVLGPGGLWDRLRGVKTQYRGGADGDVYGFHRGGTRDQVKDFDPAEDEIRADAVTPRRDK